MLVDTRSVNNRIWRSVASPQENGFSYMIGEAVIEAFYPTNIPYHSIRAEIIVIAARCLHKREACLVYVK